MDPLPRPGDRVAFLTLATGKMPALRPSVLVEPPPLDAEPALGGMRMLWFAAPNERGGELPSERTALLDAEGTWVGLAFGRVLGSRVAWPVETVAPLLSHLAEAGGAYVREAWLGVSAGDTLPSGEDAHGAYVRGFDADSPAKRDGLRVGDVIVRFDDVALDGAGPIPFLAHVAGPGHVVVLRVLREGVTTDVQVRLETPPPDL
ncbi:MAG: PDZ domain-containing protein [Polyangiaceae bacterium]